MCMYYSDYFASSMCGSALVVAIYILLILSELLSVSAVHQSFFFSLYNLTDTHVPNRTNTHLFRVLYGL